MPPNNFSLHQPLNGYSRVKKSHGTGYVDKPINKKHVNEHAPFETAAMVAAELDDRLKGRDYTT